VSCVNNSLFLTHKLNNNISTVIIYKITNTITNKVYIGQTIRQLCHRIYEYKTETTSDTAPNSRIINSFRKHGFDKFKFETIDIATSIDELNQKEIYWIDFFNSTNKLVGYNILPGGRNSMKPFEVRFKMSNAHKGTKQSQEWINKRIAKEGTDEAKKYGKEKTEEDRKRLSENSPKYWQGKSRAQETKEKISLTKKGQIPPNRKQVFKIEKNSNLLITIYNSTTEAAKQNPIFTQSKISRICNNKAESKENYTFSFSYRN